MRRIGLLLILIVGVAIAPLTAAQQPQVRARIGILSSSSTEREQNYLPAFQQSLRDLGYVEGKNAELGVG